METLRKITEWLSKQCERLVTARAISCRRLDEASLLFQIKDMKIAHDNLVLMIAADRMVLTRDDGEVIMRHSTTRYVQPSLVARAPCLRVGVVSWHCKKT